jgi:hypothetical protein
MSSHLPDLSVVVDVVNCCALEIPLGCKVRDIVVSLALNSFSVSYQNRKQIARCIGSHVLTDREENKAVAGVLDDDAGVGPRD